MTFANALDETLITWLRETYNFPFETAVAYVKMKGICTYCGTDLFASLEAYSTCEIDHILPQSKYPQISNDVNNLAFCCSICNSTKHNLDVLNKNEDPIIMISKSSAELISRVKEQLDEPRSAYKAQYKDIKSKLQSR